MLPNTSPVVVGRELAGELRERQHLLETGLVQAHLLGAHEARHGVVAHLLQRAGFEAVVDGVEDQQRVGFLHVLDQVQALGAAVDQALRLVAGGAPEQVAVAPRLVERSSTGPRR